MKRTLFAIFSLFLTACNDNVVKTIDTEELLANLDNPDYIIIDSRNDSLYNGFKDKHASRGGHIKGAIQFRCNWFERIEADKFDSFAEAKGISKQKTLVIYDSNPDELACISAEFNAKGYKVRTFSDFISYANAGYRVFWALKWAGVEDVRVLNGNLATWIDAGFPTETKVNQPLPETAFGTTIPANPQINISPT